MHLMIIFTNCRLMTERRCNCGKEEIKELCLVLFLLFSCRSAVIEYILLKGNYPLSLPDTELSRTISNVVSLFFSRQQGDI